MDRPKNMSRQAFSKATKAKQRRKKLQKHNEKIQEHNNYHNNEPLQEQLHEQFQEPLHEQFQENHNIILEQFQDHNNESIQNPNDLQIYAVSHNILRIPQGMSLPPSIYPY